MNKALKTIILTSLFLILSGLLIIWSGLKPSGSVVNTPESTSSADYNIDGEVAFVTKVVDGDTIQVNMNEEIFTIRYIGVDTPETVDPRRPVGCFGKEASNENKSLVEGKTVILQKDISETDKYNRLLRYVFLPLDENKVLFVNDYLVREGLANVSTYPPDVKYDQQFLEAQRQAKENGAGLWGRCEL